MNDQTSRHSAFDELAAGHALHALEPEDEELFLRHAEHCPRCRRLMADFQRVAAAIAETAPPADPGWELGEPRRELGERILAVALSGPGTDTARPPATSLPAPARGHRRVLAAAAAAVLIAGGAAWAALAGSGGSSRPVLAICARSHACAEVVLTSAATRREAGKVIVHDGVVWMQPTAMAANHANEIYVLWQITGAHTPLAVGSFDIRPGARTLIRVGELAAPYRGTWAFAVSLEHGRTIPARPTHPVALGQVS
jgi:hypothetical protein